MKEQWKKLDNDAKLLVDVEEGKQPIKIHIPLSALTTPQKDEFCCNRWLTVLRVCVLLALLTLIGWTVTNLYSNYYEKTIPFEEETLGNKFAFQNIVYKNHYNGANEEIKKLDPATEEFRDSTKKALDQIAAGMKGFNKRLAQIQDDKEQHQMDIKKILYDVKPIDDEVVTSERSDQTLDSLLDELAKEVGLAEYNRRSDNVDTESKSELNAINVNDPQDQESEIDINDADSQKKLEQETMDLVKQFFTEENIGESHEDSDYQATLVGDFVYQPIALNNKHEQHSLSDQFQIEAVIKNIDATENVDNLTGDAEREYFEKLNRIAAEVVAVPKNKLLLKNEIDQAIQATINKMTTSNLENDNDAKKTLRNENKVTDKLVDELTENDKRDVMDEFVNDLFVTLFTDEINKAANEDSSSEYLEFGNLKENLNEDKAEKEEMQQLNQDFRDKILEQFIDESVENMAAREMIEAMKDETMIKNDQIDVFENGDDESDKGGSIPSIFDEFFKLIGIDDENKKDNNMDIAEEKSTEYNFLPSSNIPFQLMDDANSGFFLENKGLSMNEDASIQEDPSTKNSLIEMVPSVEYVKKIEENPFIPRVAKMLEPIVGQNHELLVWYYTHKNLPDFLRGADKWKVFGAKLLYDSNINDYPADATIVSGLAFEKVYGGAEYPSSSEEIKSNLQQEIINRLILKSYLNKMLLEGNVEAETLSQVIEQHNEEKLKALNIDPQRLSYRGDFFEADNRESNVLMIPVVKFDPFVDESREANMQRAQVIKAFGRTRYLDKEFTKPSYEEDSKDFFDSISYVAPKQVKQPEIPTAAILDESKKNSESSSETLEGLLGRQVGFGMSDESPKTSDDLVWYTEFSSKELLSKPVSTKPINEEINAENTSSVTKSEEELSQEEVDMNQYLFVYGNDPLDW